MPTRNVVLTQHHEDVIESLVGSGRYQNASEVLREGLRLVEQREAEDNARLTALRDAARIGFEAIDRGYFIDFDDRESLTKHLRGLAQEAIRDAGR